MSTKKTWAAAVVALALSGAAQAALFDRGGGLIYDSTLNLTWLADMNYAQTSGYDSDGKMTQNNAAAWADGLVYGGFSDWRLPTLDPFDTTCSLTKSVAGFPTMYWGGNCTGGELSHLFVVDFGNQDGQSVLTHTGDTATQIANFALFSNVQSADYWSGTSYVASADTGWIFRGFNGRQNLSLITVAQYAVAVRSGDVTSPVPEPESLALTLLGLGAVAAASRRRKS